MMTSRAVARRGDRLVGALAAGLDPHAGPEHASRRRCGRRSSAKIRSRLTDPKTTIISGRRPALSTSISSAHSRFDSPLSACSTASPASIRRTTASICAESVTAPSR